MMRSAKLLMLAALVLGGCGAPELPGPGTEPTDTAEQNRRAGPKPTKRPIASTPDAGPGDKGEAGGALPPQYDFDLLPRCKRGPNGARFRSFTKSYEGMTQQALIDELGLPRCIHHGRWRYEIPSRKTCPEYIHTVSLVVSGGTVKDQKVYRRASGISCH